MQKWYHIIPKNTGLSLYVWLIFCGLPFFFIFRSSSVVEIFLGILLVLLFFLSYRLSFISKSSLVYLWVSIDMVISIVMTIFFGYIYFALFLAFFIGNVERKAGFVTLYIVHLVTSIATITLGFFTHFSMFFPQLPFIIISVLGIILLPFSMYFRNKRSKLEGQLAEANKQIAELRVTEERERIARDLHDTLGQKLSLIGLKSDLAGKLIRVDGDKAKAELDDIRQTARTALNEVREMVSDMRGAKLTDEIIRVKQMLSAAEIEAHLEGSPELHRTPLLAENVLSMCLKEAINNVVKHSKATKCEIGIGESSDEVRIKVEDNGVGISNSYQGNGLQGMRERLEFVNGSLEINSSSTGTTLHIRVPVIQQKQKEGLV
ncbi:sensor histidine kinase [Thalassobacillus hwangdonensis]|uniref:histidine kinase n=1 Tax=Thalassobacillus hwangdonensis TaxID=546108 RepID=A0ABW3L1C3_9BACI